MDSYLVKTNSKKSFKIDLPDSDITYYTGIFENSYLDNLFNYLDKLSQWEVKKIKVYGKNCVQNRETIFFSQNSENYRYSGVDNLGIPISQHPILENLVHKIEVLLENKYKFNYILGNRYKTGNNNIGMHSDDERTLSGPIVSLSLGSSRFFDFKSKHTDDKLRLNLENGSILVMSGNTQKNYKHGIPIQKKIKEPRINLTFRCVKN